MWSRTPARAAALAEALGARHAADPGHAEIVVNATSVGLDPNIDPFKAFPLKADTFETGSCVIDMVYGSGETRFLEAARSRGARVIDGLEMLLAQGVASFERWTGKMAPRMAMRGGHHNIAKSMNPPTQTGAAPSKPKRGITSPSRRGGSGRVLTDVLVDLEFVERAVMDDAIEKAHSAGSAAERILLTQGAITEDQLARAVAERFGLDHVALRNYKVDPDAAKLVTPAAVKRYQAVPVSRSSPNARCWSRWPTPRTCSRSTTSRS